MTGFTSTVNEQPWLLGLFKNDATRAGEHYRPLRGKLFRVDSGTAAHLDERGIVCATSYEILEIAAVLDRVDTLLSSAPDLKRCLDRNIEEVVILQAHAAEYDVNHSEPQWPGRIYTSVPPISAVQDLRLSEAVVHEAMHLNLTAFEQIAEVFRFPDTLLYSPWREEERPASGVFHGLYVFWCVERFFGRFVLPNETDEERIAFLRRRLAQIHADALQVDLDGLKQCMGIDGAGLLARIAPRG